ncbi:hypothetical protein QAD02_017291 [Eretmocerus hayati]|uniref:Uncharacterized protein n=1 Tax=Eretmocerus hayati TaxID=131215 RepID=A0ACC2PG10_9HYME|nr:hypothetical protein QAD02_017291 [Eretmocerus hayati]
MCDGYCRKVDVDVLCEVKRLFNDVVSLAYTDGQHFFARIDKCSAESRDIIENGHPITCYMEPLSCKSRFLKINILSSHHPFLRTIKRLIYDIKHLYRDIESIGTALELGNLIELQNIQRETKNIPVKCGTKNFETCLDETELTNRYVDRTEKHLIETNSKFFGLKGNTVHALLRGIPAEGIEMTWWEKLQVLYEPEYFKVSFIRHHCIGKFKVDQLPSLCILNSLSIDEVPSVIKTLNMFEKMLIQRAKAFQVLVKLGTVQKKNVPHYMKLDQVKGRTFHLPLPFEATLEKLCKETDPINLNHELYILVRSNPTKSKVIWENYIDVQKVWLALHWLKHNNSLYAHIELPSTPEQLLHHLEKTDLEYNEAPTTSRRDESQRGGVVEPDSQNNDVPSAPTGTGHHLKEKGFESQHQSQEEIHPGKDKIEPHKDSSKEMKLDNKEMTSRDDSVPEL